MTDIAQRISEILAAKGLSKTKFANDLKLSNAFVSELCSGRKAPSDRTIQDICDKFGVNEVWLRTGDGEMFRQMSRDEEITKFIAETLSGSNEFKSRLIAALARLDESDWEHLEKVARKMLEEQNK